jgi:hypothetical protein
MDDELIKSNEYFYIAIINLFASNANLNHLDKLLGLNKSSSSESTLDPWSRRAMLIACSILPEDERQHYLKHIKKNPTLSITELIMIEWAINAKNYDRV